LVSSRTHQNTRCAFQRKRPCQRLQGLQVVETSSCGNFKLLKPRIGTDVGYFGSAVLGLWDTGSDLVPATISESPPWETISKLPIWATIPDAWSLHQTSKRIIFQIGGFDPKFCPRFAVPPLNREPIEWLQQAVLTNLEIGGLDPKFISIVTIFWESTPWFLVLPLNVEEIQWA